MPKCPVWVTEVRGRDHQVDVVAGERIDERRHLRGQAFLQQRGLA